MSTIHLNVSATNLLQKMTGLIGKENPHALFLRTRWGIHTFGVKFPIDIVIVNKMNMVVKLQQSLKPNRLFFWNPTYDRVLELPEGTIEKKKIRLGDTIIFNP